ncbi:membrane protein [Arthrobacter phage Kardesai]|uniref:Membrane protein n=1 Tax=Arthrobacter phage Kardesai TaxID=2859474 RepID=A0AAE7SN01_9CAUD|nr:membrane protein [Arthrobacter phage Kardesai]QXO12994.1 membrane protein [Arthrobacter phage Kardesai]
MFWLAFWLFVIGYFVIGATRLPIYFKMYYDNDRKEYHMIRTVEQSQKEGFWYGFFLTLVWPFYETGKWVQNKVIHHLTREEREEAEYQKAQQIIKDWEAKKERQKREDFERELRNG